MPVSDDWVPCKIADVADWRGGMTPSLSEPEFWVGGTIPWVSSKDVSATVLKGTERRISAAALERTSLRLADPGSVVIVVRSGILAHTFPVAYVPFATTVNQDVKVGIPRPGITGEYLAYLLQSLQAVVLSRYTKTGTTVQSVNVSALMNHEIRVPSTPMQRRIVDLMTHMDSHLANLQTEQDLVGKVADAVRADLFARGGQSLPLAEVVEVTNGRQRSPKNASGPHMTQYIRAANVKDGAVVLDEPHFMNFDPTEQMKFGLAEGDVLVTEGCGSLSQIGASCQWNGEVPGIVCFQNHLLRLRPRSADLSPAMVYQWARHSFRSGQFAEIATGTSIFSLGATRVAKMPFPMEAVKRQPLLELASNLDLHVNGLANEVERLSEMRGTLLVSLLDGGASIRNGYDSLIETVA